MKIQIILFFLIGFVNLSIGQTSLKDSLHCYYPFNGNANDESGYGHHAFVSGATLTTDRYDNENTAFEFDGLDDYINSFSTFDYPERSLAMWVQPYSISGINPNNHVALTQDDYRLKYGVLRVDFDYGMVNLWAGGANNNYIAQAEKFLDKWTFVVLIRDSDSVSYYLNGALVYTDVSNHFGSSFDPDSTLIIGSGRSTEKQFFHGKIDDIRIYNRVLSEEEIEELFRIDTSVNQIDYDFINIYPNPAITELFIDYSESASKYQVSLIDVTGRIIFQGENVQVFNVSTFANGLYFVKIDGGNNQTIVRKFVKQ